MSDVCDSAAVEHGAEDAHAAHVPSSQSNGIEAASASEGKRGSSKGSVDGSKGERTSSKSSVDGTRSGRRSSKRSSVGSGRASISRKKVQRVPTLQEKQKMENEASGWFLDFACRTMTRLRTAGAGDDITAYTVFAIMRDETGVADVVPMYQAARSFYVRDFLESNLMRDITRELKEFGKTDQRAGWAPAKPGEFKDHALFIRKARRETGVLEKEVFNFRLREQIRQNSRRKDMFAFESPKEKKARLDAFWMMFHDWKRERPGLGPVHDKRRRFPLQREAPVISVDHWRLACEGPRPSSSPEANEQKRRPRVGAPRADAQRSGQVAGAKGGDGGKPFGGGVQSASLPNLQSGSSPMGSARIAWAADKPQPISPASGGPRSILLPPLPDASRFRYLQLCDHNRSIPTPLPFVTGHSLRIDTDGMDFTDDQVLALASLLQEGPAVKEVIFANNGFLTHRSLVPFIRCLHTERTAAALSAFTFSRCNKAGLPTLEAVVQLLPFAAGLQHLDVSGINIGARFHMPLCKAIGRHPCLLTVNLADTGLGGTVHTSQCINSLFASKTIHTVDLSWNSFGGDAFREIGEQVVGNGAIRTLRVSNCSAGFNGYDTPVSHFFQEMAKDEAVTHLDISLNRIDGNTAHIIENCLDVNSSLTQLDISNNPLGAIGLRSLLRLVAQETNVLRHIVTEGCYQGGSHEQEADGVKLFSVTNPGGFYKLNLSRPFHRALLRMLYRTSERFNCPPEQAFLNVSYSMPPYSHPARDSSGLHQVRKEGILKFTYSIERAMENFAANIDNYDFAGFLQTHLQRTRITPAAGKVVPMFDLWERLQSKAFEQCVFLEAIAKDFNLTLPIVAYLCKTAPALTDEIMVRLLPSVPFNDASRYMTFMACQRMGEYVRIRSSTCGLLDFNPQNPTGHYKLDLGNCCDNIVAAQLLLLDRWEATVDRRLNRFDASARGNRSHIRNETYQGRPLAVQYQSVAEWSLPEDDIFELDYISGARAPDQGLCLSPECFGKLLLHVYESQCQADDKILAMRRISSHFCLTALQMRQMLGFFKTPAERINVVLMYFFRITDIHNAKLFRVRFQTWDEVRQLYARLGYITFFPFMQPENGYFELDLSFHDQRTLGSLLVQMSGKEKTTNLREPVWVRADGYHDKFSMGVPRSWENAVSMPTSGVFKLTYVCAPEDRQFAFRLKLTEMYSFFSTAVKENEVMWWTGLTEPPEDVIGFLEFLIGNFSNHKEVFKLIDGADGNGVITLREFEEAVREMGCMKFKDPPAKESQRVAAVFRYLDPGGEGSVSEYEWDMLGQLWNEFDLSVREFVQFLQRVFGDDLSVAWNYLDADGSGELDLEEWLHAVQEIGYFGPSRVVFAILDGSDDGAISSDEFGVLERYKMTMPS